MIFGEFPDYAFAMARAHEHLWVLDGVDQDERAAVLAIGNRQRPLPAANEHTQRETKMQILMFIRMSLWLFEDVSEFNSISVKDKTIWGVGSSGDGNMICMGGVIEEGKGESLWSLKIELTYFK